MFRTKILPRHEILHLGILEVAEWPILGSSGQEKMALGSHTSAHWAWFNKPRPQNPHVLVIFSTKPNMFFQFAELNQSSFGFWCVWFDIRWYLFELKPIIFWSCSIRNTEFIICIVESLFQDYIHIIYIIKRPVFIYSRTSSNSDYLGAPHWSRVEGLVGALRLPIKRQAVEQHTLLQRPGPVGPLMTALKMNFFFFFFIIIVISSNNNNNNNNAAYVSMFGIGLLLQIWMNPPGHQTEAPGPKLQIPRRALLGARRRREDMDGGI